MPVGKKVDLMKQIAVVLAACAAMAMSSAATAQTTRVAYVDIDRVTEKSDKINKAMASVQDRVKKIQQDIESKTTRLAELRLEIKKGEGVLADSELKKKRDETSKLEKEMVDLEHEGKQEMMKLDTTVFEPMVKTIVLAIQDVAKEQNIDLVVRGEAVIYGANSADITDAVVKKLNSASYNPGSGNKDTSEAKDSDSESTKSSSSTSESAAKADSASENGNGDSNAKGSGESESKRAIFPTVPLVTRPVDRQSE